MYIIIKHGPQLLFYISFQAENEYKIILFSQTDIPGTESCQFSNISNLNG